jgi:hypothetical protein
VISGTAASAFDSGQFFFAVSASSWNFALSMPGICASSVSAMRFDQESLALLHEAHGGLGVHDLGLEPRLVAGERERHREACGVRRAHDLLGVGAPLVAFEAARESVRVRRQRARLGADLTLALLAAAFPMDGGVLLDGHGTLLSVLAVEKAYHRLRGIPA